MDSAYWLSWFLIFQILTLSAVGLAMLVAVVVRTKEGALQDIDLGLLFCVLWMAGSSIVVYMYIL
jgi:hypothetical protein